MHTLASKHANAHMHESLAAQPKMWVLRIHIQSHLQKEAPNARTPRSSAMHLQGPLYGVHHN
jgi:hypothetical protein